MDMQNERRAEPKRSPLEKTVAVVGPNGATLVSGTTTNISDAGIGADFDSLPEMGPDVRLRLFWSEESKPIEQRAQLVWTEPAAKSGVSVGFRLLDADEVPVVGMDGIVSSPDNSQSTQPVDAPQMPLLEEGSAVWLQMGSVAIQAEVAVMGEIREDNRVDLSLRITDPAFLDPRSVGDDALTPESMDFTAHPFRDAWRACEPYLRPVIAFALKVSVSAFSAAKRAAKRAEEFWRERRDRKSA